MMSLNNKTSNQPMPLRLIGCRVLLIEDHLDARTLFTRIIQKAGAEVHAASSIKEARSALSAFHPDVIVSDIGLPDEDGISFMKQFRTDENPTGQHTPAVAVTAYSHLKDLVIAAGFDLFLCKPTSGSDLVSLIVKALNLPTLH
jgi:CheY-like chemotaxis protein